MRAIAVALELEDAVDEVLEHARARDDTLLRHVTHEERGDALLLRHAEKPAGCLTHLSDRARCGAQLGSVERLHGVDHADLGPLSLESRADLVEIRLGKDVHICASAEPVGAQLHLRYRLLARDEQNSVLGAQGAQRHEEERRLPDPGVSADKHEAGRDQPSAEDAVELGDAGGDPLGIACLHIDEPEERPACSGCRAFGHGGDPLLDEGPPASARGALAEPLPGRVPAF